jgi:integrase
MATVRQVPCPVCRRAKCRQHPEARRQPYEVRYRDPDGTQRTARYDGADQKLATKADADALSAALETDMRRGQWVNPADSRTPVGEVARAWLASNPSKRPSARARDETILRVHIEPALGRRPIGSVTRSDVRKLIAVWSAGLAPRTVRRMFGVLRAVFAFAVDDEVVVRSPCRGVKLPAVGELRRPPVDADAVTALAAALGVDYAPMAYLGAALGLRWGECAGLRVGRLDFMRGTLTVAEQLTRGERGRAVAGEPKSDAGRRTLTVPAPLMEMLSEHLARRGLTGADVDAFVFAMPGGGPLDYSRWRRRVWLPATREVGLEGLTFHDLRRANATAMVLDGVDLRTAQSRLGHSDPRLTLGVYAAATSEGDQAAADRLGARFLGVRGANVVQPRRARP